MLFLPLREFVNNALRYRGISWNWLVRNVPAPKKRSRIRFAIVWFAKGTCWFLVSDLLYLAMTSIVYPLSEVRFTAMAPATRAVFLTTIFWRIYGLLICPFYVSPFDAIVRPDSTHLSGWKQFSCYLAFRGQINARQYSGV